MSNGEAKHTSAPCACPYCDATVEQEPFPFCVSCGKRVVRCAGCNEPVRSEEQTCPKCGAPLESK